MSSAVGSLESRFTLDNSQFLAKMVEQGTVTERESKRMQNALKFIESQLRANASAQKAANDSSAGLVESGKQMEQFGFQTAAAKRELLVLTHELSQGNFSRFGGSLLVLGERTGAAALLFSGLGAAALGAAAAVAGMAGAAIAGAREQEAFNKALVLTGNYAGVTGASFTSMAARVADATHSTIGASREALQALVASGQVGPQNIEAAARATLTLSKLTGQSSEEVAKDFARMADGVTKWAVEHNRQLNFITVAEYQHIKALEDSSRAQQAQGAVYDAINEKTPKTIENVGNLAAAYERLAGWASKLKQGLMDWGKTPDLGMQYATLQERLQATLGAPGGLYSNSIFHDADGHQVASRQLALDSIRARMASVKALMDTEQKAADARAAQAAKDKARIDELTKDHTKYNPLSAIQGGFASDELVRSMGLEPQPHYNYLDAGAQQQQADFLRSEKSAYEPPKWLSFDEQFPPANVSKIMKDQEDNADAHRLFFEQERKDGEELARQFAAYVPPKMNDLDAAAKKWLEDLPDNAKKAEQLVGGSFSRMEDAVVNFAHTGKLSLGSFFSFMADEYIRNLVRMGEKQLFTDSAGKFTGFAGAASNITSWLSGLFGSSSSKQPPAAADNWAADLAEAWGSMFAVQLASGLDYVPYDGFPAILHKGERVQTAVQASAQRSGGGETHIDASSTIGSVGAGVSYAQMAAALKASQNATLQQVKRLQRQGVL